MGTGGPRQLGPTSTDHRMYVLAPLVGQDSNFAQIIGILPVLLPYTPIVALWPWVPPLCPFAGSIARHSSITFTTEPLVLIKGVVIGKVNHIDVIDLSSARLMCHSHEIPPMGQLLQNKCVSNLEHGDIQCILKERHR